MKLETFNKLFNVPIILNLENISFNKTYGDAFEFHHIIAEKFVGNIEYSENEESSFFM